MNYLAQTLQKLQNKTNVFLTGGAGVGKTMLTRSIIEEYEREAKKVAKLASTGMAATLISGQTLHSFFDLGIANDLNELRLNAKYEISKRCKKVVASMSLVVIDEISMVSASLFEMIALRLKQAEFSGVLLVVGDFLQLPPVVRGGAEMAFAFSVEAWREFAFEELLLTHIYRTDDTRFIELLHQVRFGYVDEALHNHLNEFIKPLPSDLRESTFLFGKNSSAETHNKTQLDFLEGELLSQEAQIIRHSKEVSDAQIDRFMLDARIERVFEFKIGAPVLFTRNAWNYFNGERGVIINADTSYIYVQKSDMKVVKLERIAQSKKVWKEQVTPSGVEMVEETLLSVYQFPIRLAFAITIHKSQGMSIEDLIIETNEIFAPSQFYVALSRSSNPQRLTLIAPKCQWYELIYVHPHALAFVQK